MKKFFLILITILVVGGLVYAIRNQGGKRTGKEDLIRVTAPETGEVVMSPLVVRGEARGNWYFEASFPIELLDAAGNRIAVNTAQAQGEWMTTEFVPFESKLIFSSQPAGSKGTLVLHKDNPSGLPENEDELRIPISFGESESKTRTIKLYYYNESKDKDASGNVLCARNGGLDAVEREVPLTITPIQDAVKLLLTGELTLAEKSEGLSTEYPLPGFKLVGASQANGVLTLTFDDPEHKATGGSCRVDILRAQVEATAKQFGMVKEVKFAPSSIFQP
jgi:hypothetical protein